MIFSRKTSGLLLLSICVCGIAAAQGYSPNEAVKRMTVADGLGVSLFAHEPQVRQPIFVKCDDKGRLWTIQYLQYPNPAGLKRVSVDRWSRTIYDRVPKPPPHGPRGADRLTICEDVDGDGTADHFKDFVDGLNLVTGVAFGHGGVFVLNVPYLLFFPDRDRDDAPDSDPEVLLTGFGMEDAQSLSNHLTWGPDGWLYGVNGSTTTCIINGAEFQSGVWRYHPITKEFEVFSEGGYNCYGITFNEHGELFYSTNGGPFVHAMQGAYYYKSFGKHGPLHNLYAYHHFPILDCDQVPGGPPTGGTVYLEPSFPRRLHSRFIAGNFLGHTTSYWNVHPKGSTFRATFGDILLDSHDTWFGPTDMCVGPDGAIYVCDFHDQRTAHPDPDANWDLSNGRIFKITTKSATPHSHADVRQQTSNELVNNLRQSSRWLADRSRIELARRQDRSVAPELLQMVQQSDRQTQALEGLWALHAVGELNEATAVSLLEHRFPYVRYWAVRLLGDAKQVRMTTAEKLAQLARRESSAPVVAQLACTARRLPADAALPIVAALLESEVAAGDERIPWLIWWAVNEQAETATDRLAKMFATNQAWSMSTMRDHALRLIRRWSSQGNKGGYDAALRLLRSTPTEHQRAALESLRLGLSERATGLHGIGQGTLFTQQAAENDAPQVEIRPFEPLPVDVQQFVTAIWNRDRSDVLALEIALRANAPGASSHLLDEIQNSSPEDPALIDLLRLLRDVGDAETTTAALVWIAPSAPSAILQAALAAVDANGSLNTIATLLVDYGRFPPDAQSQLRDMFLSRADLALQFLKLVEQGEIAAETVPVNQLFQVAAHNDDEIDRLVQRNWGKIGRGSSEEILATMRRLSNDLRAGTGNLANGKALFTKHCATCHQLHGEGNKIGPDLTTANRKDRAALLENIVNPNEVVRREYSSYVVATDAGRRIVGMLAEENAAAVTLLDAENRRIRVARDEIEELRPSDVSLMPERLLDKLSPQELRDLFSYLED